MNHSPAPITRPLLTVERAALAHSGKAHDATYVRLLMALTDAGSAYEAADDGALHHAYPADVADAKYYAVKRDYDRAGTALSDYARSVAR